MIKVIMPLKKKLGVSQKDFNDHWLNNHSQLAARLIPGLRRYVLSYMVGENQEFDGVAELYFDDVASWHRALDFLTKENGGQVIRDDNVKFVDIRRIFFLVTEEKVIKEK